MGGKAAKLTITESSKPLNFIHVKCRTSVQSKPVFYQTGKNEKQVERPYVPDNKVSWKVEFEGYKGEEYTAPIVKSQPFWADPQDTNLIGNWNNIDGNINRKSHHGQYELVKGENGKVVPQNPMGRTGICGRGLLGKWGPNHAADPIVTRWKKENGRIVVDPNSGKKILQFIAIQRVDTKEWAIPGGMCDPGEKISLTLKREFFEEVLDSGDMTVDGKKNDKLDKFFKGGKQIYQGYVDDPRNTDNAWMETTAYHFHDDEGTIFQDVKLKAGDDAQSVKWVDINKDLKLYASHKDFIEKAVNGLKNAHW